MYVYVTIRNRYNTRSFVIKTHPHPGQNGRHLADTIYRYSFVNENFWILIKISPKFVPKGQIDNNPALV